MNQNITQNKNYSSGKAARAALQASDAVLFDLDGTLVDSMWMWKEIDIEYLGRFGLSCPPDLQKIIEGMSFSETAEYFKHRFQILDSIDAIKADWIRMSIEKFQIIATACEVAAGKPAPDIYLEVARRLQAEPSRCMVFEDVPAGILAGKRAGMRVCGVEDAFSTGMREEKIELADFYIDDYNELFDTE